MKIQFNYASIINHSIWIILSLLFVFWFSVTYLSEGSIDMADSLIHFKIARQAFKQPEFFLDLWAKPLFTVLCSTFAQFGYMGAKFFNLLIAFITASVGYKLAKRLEIRNAFLYPVFLLFFPIYAITMISSLTEILFGFVMLLAIYFFFENKFIWSAIVISFIPFARTEGFGVLAAFAFVFAINRNFRSIPFLLLGTLFFSLVGWSYYNDFFWTFTKIPYSNAGSTLYGSGNIFFYWKDSEWIFGTPLMLLITAGSFFIFYQIIKTMRKTNPFAINPAINELLLIWMIFFGFIFFQSFIWYKGIMAVLGSHRFIASIAPVGALIALRGFDSIVRLTSTRKWVAILTSIIILFFVIQKPFILYHFPIKLDPESALFRDASKWLKNSPYSNRKIFYANPFLFHFLEIDPYNKSKSDELTPSTIGFEEYVPLGSIVIWDAHLSANEGKLPESRITHSPHFRLLKSFYPEIPFKVLGDRDYCVHLAEKILPVSSLQFQSLFRRTANYFKIDSTRLKNFLFVDFDGESAPSHQSKIKVIDSQTLDNAVILNSENPFLIITEAKRASLPFANNSDIYFCSSMEAIDFNKDETDFDIVVSVSRDDNNILLVRTSLDDLINPGTGFHDVCFAKNIPDGLRPDDYVKIFLQYRGTKNVFVTNLSCFIVN